MLAKELLKKMCISYSNMDDETYLFKGVYKRRRSKEIVITIKDEIYYYN